MADKEDVALQFPFIKENNRRSDMKAFFNGEKLQFQVVAKKKGIVLGFFLTTPALFKKGVIRTFLFLMSAYAV